jgi:hypothetical protein
VHDLSSDTELSVVNQFYRVIVNFTKVAPSLQYVKIGTEDNIGMPKSV